MRRPLASRRPIAALLLSGSLATSLACGEPTVTAAGPQHRVVTESRGVEASRESADAQTMAEIAALGYANWSEETTSDHSGAIQHDPSATAPGYNFLTDHADDVFLLDSAGTIVHRWTLPGTERSLFAELVEGGRIVASLGPDTLAMLGPDSEVLWTLPISAHHDAAMAADGSLFVLTNRWILYKGRQVLFDGIAHVSADGELLSQWWTFDWLHELQAHHALRPIDTPPRQSREAEGERGKTPPWEGVVGLPPSHEMELRDYYHANSIELLPDTPLGRRDPRFRAGNVMICLHQVNLVVVLDQDDFSVTWSWGADELDWPHMPTMLDNGNILVFDNGSHRGYSRVLEIDPPTGEIVWRYLGEPRESFYTKFRGCNERLPNGNTLICESENARVFEVTQRGRIVWEYWSPIVEGGKRRRISRFTRYPEEFVAPLLEGRYRTGG